MTGSPLRPLRHLPWPAVAALVAGLAGALVLLAVFDALVIRPLPGVPAASRVHVFASDRVSYPSLAGFAAAAQRSDSGIAAIAGYSNRWFALSAGGGAGRRVLGAAVAGDYFGVAGGAALRGRLLGPTDDRPDAPPVAVIAESLWRDELAGDAAVVGREILLNGVRFTVVGVAPRAFRGFERQHAPAVWVSAQAWFAAAPSPFARLSLDRWGWSWIQPLARLAPDADARAASARLQVEADRQVAEHPEAFDARFPIELVPATRLAAGFPSAAAERLAGGALVALVALLLVLAGASAAHVFLARGEARRAELATRLALGADRRRIAATLLAEPLVAALVAVPAAVLAARGALLWLAVRPLPGGLRLGDLGLAIDARVALAGALLAVACGGLAGLVPMGRLLRQDLSQVLLGRTLGSRAATRSRSALVVTQVALSLLLVAAASLCLRALSRAAAVETGYDGEQLAFVALDAGLLRAAPQRARELYAAALAETAAQPAVTAAALVSHLPLDPGVDQESVVVAGYEPAPDERPRVEPQLVSALALSTLGIGLVAGREIDERDRAGGEAVVVISEAAARRWFAGRDPIGGRLSLNGLDFAVVGVARDVRAHGLGDLQAPAAYFAYEQAPDVAAGGAMAIVARGRRSADEALAAARRAVASATPGLPAEPSGTYTALVAAAAPPQRLGVALFGLFAVVGTLLAALGLYGLVAHSAAARTREIGLRLALGARHDQVLRELARAALVPTLAGAALGTPLAFAVTAAARGLFFGLERLDAVAPLAAAAILLVTAALAAALPAWRAARVDPMTALRES
jgi:putative ABC transport system permease protein